MSVDVCPSGRDVFSIHYCQTIRNESVCPKRFLVWWSERPRVGLSFFVLPGKVARRVPNGGVSLCSCEAVTIPRGREGFVNVWRFRTTGVGGNRKTWRA